MYRKKAHIHFVGIGGIGMSGIAKILRYQGYTISGCDKDLDQKSVKDLQAIGCTIFEGNDTPQCQEQASDILVYSSAIKVDNPEIVAAQTRGIPTINRPLMLAELMRTKFSIAIAGAHGKTTTTSLISHILIEAKLDPTVIIGGHLKSISANARLGTGDFLVAETDESDRSLAHLQATLAVVTNIDFEHVETYKDLDDIKATFLQFLNNLPFYGKAIVCIDNEHVRSLLPLPHIKLIKYGIEHHEDIYADNIRLEADHSIFTLHTRQNVHGTVKLNMPGKHNILNALAAIGSALELDIPLETIISALNNFKGIERRFSFKGGYKGADVFDDYGHHPEEIRNTLLVAHKRTRNKLVMVFQPHRYSRTQKLENEFISMFMQSGLHHLIVTDIHQGPGEDIIPGVTAQRFVDKLQKHNPAFHVTYAPLESDFKSIRAILHDITHEGDLILLQGAGKINKLAEALSK